MKKLSVRVLFIAVAAGAAIATLTERTIALSGNLSIGELDEPPEEPPEEYREGYDPTDRITNS